MYKRCKARKVQFTSGVAVKRCGVGGMRVRGVGALGGRVQQGYSSGEKLFLNMMVLVWRLLSRHSEDRGARGAAVLRDGRCSPKATLPVYVLNSRK